MKKFLALTALASVLGAASIGAFAQSPAAAGATGPSHATARHHKHHKHHHHHHHAHKAVGTTR